MTDDLSFDRLARDWLEAGPVDAPDRAIQAAFFQIDDTPQERRLLFPWRHPMFSTMRSVTIAAALVVGFGLLMVAQRPPTDNPSVGASPVASMPGVAVGPSPATDPCETSTSVARPPDVAASPPPLNLVASYTSARYGYVISIGSGWTASPASEAWTLVSGNSAACAWDQIQVAGTDTTISIAAHTLTPGETFENVLTDYAAFVAQDSGVPPACKGGDPSTWGPVTVGTDANGRWLQLCNAALAFAEANGRVYALEWGNSSFNPTHLSIDDFKQVLTTVHFAEAPVSSPTDAPFDLSGRFTSARFGFSISVDPRWTPIPATKDWQGYWNDGTDEDQIRIGVSTLTGASQPVPAGETVDQWLAAGFPDQKFGSGCTSDPPEAWAPTQIGDVSGRFDTVCSVGQAVAESHGRVYLFTWGFGGYSDLDGMTIDGFKQVLLTVRFTDASSPSPSH